MVKKLTSLYKCSCNSCSFRVSPEISKTRPLNSSSKPDQTTVQSNTMEKFFNEMKTYDEQRETEIENFKKCEDQETLITSMKKCLQMDKLEAEFETYKKDMALKLKSLEDAKTQLQNTQATIQKKFDTANKALTTERTRIISFEISLALQQGKIDNLTKQLADEKAQLKKEKSLRIAAEDKVFKFESQITLNKVVPNNQTNGVPVQVAPNSQTDGVPVTPNPIPTVTVVASVIKSTSVTNGVIETKPLITPLKLIINPTPTPSLKSVRTVRATRKRKSFGSID